MLAENNEYLKEATETVYEISQEEQIRMQCEAREDYNRRMLGIGRLLAKQTRELKEQAAARGARTIFNVKFETASITKGAAGQVSCVEVLAYGTALIEPERRRD